LWRPNCSLWHGTHKRETVSRFFFFLFFFFLFFFLFSLASQVERLFLREAREKAIKRLVSLQASVLLLVVLYVQDATTSTKEPPFSAREQKTGGATDLVN